MFMKNIVIAIDGPAGSGKSTVSKIVAKKLGIANLDTGAMYRAITYKLLKLGVSLDDVEEIKHVLQEIKISVEQKDTEFIIFIDGEDVSKKIRSEYISANVNIVASIPEVRKKLREIQRYIGSTTNCVIEGRDITTAVFPDTKYKFYLDAPIEERVRRRFAELKQKGEEVDFDSLKESIARRDKLDQTRGINPLRVAEDAIVINTQNLSAQQVAEVIIEHIKKLS
jgi:cytidylate kinase